MHKGKSPHHRAEAKVKFQNQVYRPNATVSRVQHRVAGLFIMSQDPTRDAYDHRICIARLERALERLAEVKHGT